MLLSHNVRGSIAVAGGFLVHLVLGTAYLWGNIVTYVGNYLAYHSDGKYTVVDLSLVQPLIEQAYVFSIPLGTILLRKFGVRLSMVIVVLLQCGGVFVSSYMTGLYSFSILYGVFTGFAGGLGYMIPILNSITFFPEKRGLVTGVILSGFGLGAFVFSFVAHQLMNPNNEDITGKGGDDINRDVAELMPRSLRILSLIYLGIMVIANLMLLQPKQSRKSTINVQSVQSAMSEDQSQSQSLMDDNKSDPEQNIAEEESENVPDSLFIAIKHYLLYIIMIIISIALAFGSLIASQFKYMFNDVNQNTNNDSFLTLIGALSSIFSCVSRPIWGSLIDRYPFKKLMIINLAISTVLSLTIQFVLHSRLGYTIFVFIAFLNYGGQYSLYPSITFDLFGKKYGGSCYGLEFQGSANSMWIQYIMVEFIKQDKTINGGWIPILYAYGGLSALGILIVLFTQFKINWKKYNKK